MSSYSPAGVQSTAVMRRNATLPPMEVEPWLPRAARRRPQARALGALTYAELDERVRRAAGALGARPGERVAIALPPGREFAVALHACLVSGAVAVPVELRLHDPPLAGATRVVDEPLRDGPPLRSEEHTSELQSHSDLVCRLLLEKKKKKDIHLHHKKKKNKTTN